MLFPFWHFSCEQSFKGIDSFSGEDSDEGARSAMTSMSVDIEVVDGNSQYMEGSVVMEDTNEQTVIETQTGTSSATDSRQSKTSESDVTMDTDSERESKPGNNIRVWRSPRLSLIFESSRFYVLPQGKPQARKNHRSSSHR